MSIKVMAINGVVAFQTKGDHFTGMSIREAHEHVQAVLEAINSAQGFGDAMAGKVKMTRDCPRCKARAITPRHVCKRVRA
jgi:hypothetical protein